jgi:hypothetical protein
MKTFFKVVIWIAALFFGLFVWNVLPDFRPLVSSILAAAFACYVLSVIVEVTIKRVMSDEQLELRSRLELLDRKVTAILRDALEQRRLRWRLEAMIAAPRLARCNIRHQAGGRAGNAPTMPANLMTRYGMTLDAQ